MASRNHQFEVDEYYHCYNRGAEKRTIFEDTYDYSYFLESLRAYNSNEVLGKMRLYKDADLGPKIVDIVSFCLLPNHYHLILEERTENGISNFMKRVAGGYTMYFNEKYEHSGVVFQGSFKSKHVETDQDLKQLISYVTLNNLVHNITDPLLFRSSASDNKDLVLS
jgi:putative transposase